MPRIYLANLVSDSALFYHPDCGDIFTFGWCSEREMAFSNLMTILGFNVKIKQTGIHVWSELLVKDSSKGISLIVMVDNTFNSIDIKMLNVSGSEWKKDYGEGTQVAWYNKKALSDDEIQTVKRISVSTVAENRIRTMVKDWFGRF